MSRRTLGSIKVALANPSQAEAEAGTAKTARVWTAERVKQAIAALASARGQLSGLAISNNATAYKIDVAEGKCRGVDDDENITLAAFSKLATTSWVTGSGNNGLATGATARAANVWYHVFAVSISGAYDIMFDSSVTCANGVANHAVTAFRRIGSVLNNSGDDDLLDFSQVGDDFLWDDPPLDVEVINQGTTAASYTLSTPPDVKTVARINALTDDNAGALMAMYVSSLDANDEAPNKTMPASAVAPLATMSMLISTSAGTTAGVLHIRTNTSSQIRARSDTANSDLAVATLGWIDTRGRND